MGSLWRIEAENNIFPVNYAHVMGLAQDTNTNASQFSYLATFFYVGYLFCEIPNTYMIQRLPVAKYLGVNGECIGSPLSESRMWQIYQSS
jgi:hypothetical protein